MEESFRIKEERDILRSTVTQLKARVSSLSDQVAQLTENLNKAQATQSMSKLSVDQNVSTYDKEDEDHCFPAEYKKNKTVWLKYRTTHKVDQGFYLVDRGQVERFASRDERRKVVQKLPEKGRHAFMISIEGEKKSTAEKVAVAIGTFDGAL